MKGPVPFDSLFECIPALGSERHALLLDFCRHHHSHVLASMPFIAAEIAAYCGYYAFFELIREYGGTKINIGGGAARLTERYGLAISAQDYERLLYHTECDWVDLPSAWGVFMALRRTAIMAEYNGFRPSVGPSFNRTLAQKYGVSERYVRKLFQERN